MTIPSPGEAVRAVLPGEGWRSGVAWNPLSDRMAQDPCPAYATLRERDNDFPQVFRRNPSRGRAASHAQFPNLTLDAPVPDYGEADVHERAHERR